MKHIKKCAWIIALLLLFTSLQIPLVAQAETQDGVEVVLLFDVSGSMNTSDPEIDGVRLSIEAAYQFVFNYPTEENLYITVVPYSSGVYSEFDKVNVATEKGRETFNSYMEAIMDDSLENFICWRKNTDIGSALELANNILSKSTDSDKKAVILFTDGKIDLAKGDALTTEQSVEKAEKNSKALREAGIPIYSIGLNCSGNNVDANQLNSISGKDNVRIVSKAADLIGVFTEVYAFLFENAQADVKPDSFQVAPDVVSEREIRIYGEAVKEANISLSSGAALHTIKVTSPSGVVVAELDLRNPDGARIEEKLCVINTTPSGYNATIKLIAPMDGNWTVSVTGEKSTVITRKIYLFDLNLSDNAPTEAYVGDTFKYSTAIYNENNTHLTSFGLYDSAEGAKARADIKRVDMDSVSVYNGTLNASKNGYDFSFNFDSEGEYILTTTISHSQFEVTTEKTIKVVGPKLTVSAKANDAEGKINVGFKFVNPFNGSALDSLPQYLLGGNVIATAYRDGNEEDSVEIPISEFENGEFVTGYVPGESGTYTFKVSFGVGDSSVDVDFGDEISFTKTEVSEPEPEPEPEPKPEPKPQTSTITLVGDITDSIEASGLTVSYETELKLEGAGKDSDGDKLTITVDVNDSAFDVEYDEKTQIVTLKCNGAGEGTLNIKATDGKGAEYVHEIELLTVEYIDTIIIIAVVVLVLIVALVVFLLILKKKKVISIAFKVKLETTAAGSYNSTQVVYSVVRLSNKKTAKGTMTLAQILDNPSYASEEVGTTMSANDIRSFIDANCHNIVLTGVPFKKQFKIEQKDERTKKVKRKYIFKKANIVVRIDENTEITFGNTHAQF